MDEVLIPLSPSVVVPPFLLLVAPFALMLCIRRGPKPTPKAEEPAFPNSLPLLEDRTIVDDWPQLRSSAPDATQCKMIFCVSSKAQLEENELIQLCAQGTLQLLQWSDANIPATLAHWEATATTKIVCRIPRTTSMYVFPNSVLLSSSVILSSPHKASPMSNHPVHFPSGLAG